MWEGDGKGLTLYDGPEGGSNFDGGRQRAATVEQGNGTGLMMPDGRKDGGNVFDGGE